MHTPPVAARGSQLQPWKASHLLLWLPSIIDGRLPGIPRDVFLATHWKEKLSCLSNRVWLGCSDVVNVVGESGLGGDYSWLLGARKES